MMSGTVVDHDDALTLSLPPPPSAQSSLPMIPEENLCPTQYANGDVAVQQLKAVGLDQSAELSAQAQRLSTASDVYFSQFLTLLEDEIESAQLKDQQQQKRESHNFNGTFPSLDPRFHACSCVDCLKLTEKGLDNPVWRALPDCITTTLAHSGLRIELLSCGALHLNGPHLSLFIGQLAAGDSATTPNATTVVVTFHSTSKVLLRSGGDGGVVGGKERSNNPQQQPPSSNICELDILSQPYTVSLRPQQASLTSSANLLTYVIDKAGTTKTKIVKQKASKAFSSTNSPLSLGSEEDQVLKAVHKAITGARAQWQTETKKRIREKMKEEKALEENKEKVGEKEEDKDNVGVDSTSKSGKTPPKQQQKKQPPLKYHRKWQLPGKEKKQQKEQSQNNFWSFEDGLTILDHSDGTLQLYYCHNSKIKKGQQSNEPKQPNLQLLVNSKHFYLQLGQQVIVLDQSGHLFVGTSYRKGVGDDQEMGEIQPTFPSPFSSKGVSPQESLAAVCAQLAPTTAHAFDGHKKYQQQQDQQHTTTNRANNYLRTPLNPPMKTSGGGSNDSQVVEPAPPTAAAVFSLPALLAIYEQYALGGPGTGLFVKHRHYHRAGLNARNLICLL